MIRGVQCLATVKRLTFHIRGLTSSVVVFLKFWAHEILTKFWRNFRQILGKFRRPLLPTPPPQKREKLYILHCAKFTFSRNCDNTTGYLDLSYFNDGMFNFVQVMWNFRKILGEILTKLSEKSFLKKIQTFESKSFWKFSCEMLTKVSLPQHYSCLETAMISAG